ncbi:MAG: NADH-quinone oxidoreductase subunit L [Thermoplasmata archaeon]
MDFAVWFIFLSPLLASPIALVTGMRKIRLAGIISSASIAISFILSGYVYLTIGSSTIHESYSWFANLSYGVYVDHLAVVMVLMVSFVSLMIHLFATYYMKEDPKKHVYFAETALFTSAMLGVILSSNLVILFLFWEIVGLCSYLLIGFWYFKPNAASAAKKAFIVTRVGDMSLIIGLAILYSSLSGTYADPLSIPTLIGNAPAVAALIGPGKLALVTIFILGGAIGKSAQFPLHVWIPDAMEGPTTVSALIHAATMVTAGVYLIARIFPLFLDSASFSLYVVAFIGAFTAIYSGTLAWVMNDVKRVLAYSTISQIGYMMAALGIGGIIGSAGVSLALYQLVVHAFFKALLFLSAGAILIALMDLRDLREMGGLWRRMPWTVTLMFIGAITLAGIPPAAGFFSKGAIVDASWSYYISSGYNAAHILPWVFLAFGEFFTAFYTFRMFSMVALGKPRSYLAEHARDPPKYVLIPLMALAVLALIFGLFQTSFYKYLDPGYVAFSVPLMQEVLVYVLIAVGVMVGIYVGTGNRWKKLDTTGNRAYKVLKNKYYLDKLYTNLVAVRGILPLSAAFSGFEYRYNSANESTGHDVVRLGSALRKIQSGIIENYFILLVLIAAIIFLLVEIIGGSL